MIDIHYRQINRPLQPGGDHFTTAELNVLNCKTGDFYCFESSVPDVSKFVACGDWYKAITFAIKRHKDKIGFFSIDGIRQHLSAAGRLAEKGRKQLELLHRIADTPGDDVDYSESFETFVIDHFPDCEDDE